MKWHAASVRLVLVAVLLGGLTLGAAGCARLSNPLPGCGSYQRLALVAQSVPGASFVPCVGALPTGWSGGSLDVHRGHTEISLLSDRANGRPVVLRYAATCDYTGAVAIVPRASGVQTYMRLTSIDPRYQGVLFDVFPGGCISYRFDFRRGPHITLMREFQSAVELVSRRAVRIGLHDHYGLDLDP